MQPTKHAAGGHVNASVVRELAELAARLAAVAVRLAEGGDGAGLLTEMLTEKEAADEAKVSLRTLRDARRSGALVMYGTQRSRTVRRSDLAAWIESRRVKPSAGVDDADIERRMKRLARGAAKLVRAHDLDAS